MFDHCRNAVRPTDLPIMAGDYWLDALTRHAEHVNRAEFIGPKRASKLAKQTSVGSSTGAEGPRVGAQVSRASAPAASKAVARSGVAPSPSVVAATPSKGPLAELQGKLSPHTPVGPEAKWVPPGALRLVAQTKDEMQRMRNHFLVLTLAPPTENPPEGEAPAAASEGGWRPLAEDSSQPATASTAFDTRLGLLSLCKTHHWQFDEPRFAVYSTRMLLHVLHHGLCFSPDMKTCIAADPQSKDEPLMEVAPTPDEELCGTITAAQGPGPPGRQSETANDLDATADEGRTQPLRTKRPCIVAGTNLACAMDAAHVGKPSALLAAPEEC